MIIEEYGGAIYHADAGVNSFYIGIPHINPLSTQYIVGGIEIRGTSLEIRYGSLYNGKTFDISLIIEYV